MAIEDFIPVKFDKETYRLSFLDQTLLPNEEKYIEMRTVKNVYDAIKSLALRGAPAIGVGAGFGMWLAAFNSAVKLGLLNKIAVRMHEDQADPNARFQEMITTAVDEWYRLIIKDAQYLISARPTAVNLEWAVKRVVARFKDHVMKLQNEGFAQVCDRNRADGSFNPRAAVYSFAISALDAMLDEAFAIQREDEESCLNLAENGLSLLKPGMGILTHCNAGVLATAGYGTALAPLHLGQERGYGFKVYADETRPLLQGARLTSWELAKSGVDVTLICDNMASIVMKKGLIDAVVVGCDRMAANGDGANKIGTSGVAILAKEYGIPFYMFVPTSTIDMSIRSGEEIVIEERNGDEIRTMWYEKPMAPENVKTFNPAFDVTDHEYITAIVTERGIVYPPFEENLARIMTENGMTDTEE